MEIAPYEIINRRAGDADRRERAPVIDQRRVLAIDHEQKMTPGCANLCMLPSVVRKPRYKRCRCDPGCRNLIKIAVIHGKELIRAIRRRVTQNCFHTPAKAGRVLGKATAKRYLVRLGKPVIKRNRILCRHVSKGILGIPSTNWRWKRYGFARRSHVSPTGYQVHGQAASRRTCGRCGTRPPLSKRRSTADHSGPAYRNISDTRPVLLLRAGRHS